MLAEPFAVGRSQLRAEALDESEKSGLMPGRRGREGRGDGLDLGAQQLPRVAEGRMRAGGGG
jgi:hypothetical protein